MRAWSATKHVQSIHVGAPLCAIDTPKGRLLLRPGEAFPAACPPLPRVSEETSTLVRHKDEPCTTQNKHSRSLPPDRRFAPGGSSRRHNNNNQRKRQRGRRGMTSVAAVFPHKSSLLSSPVGAHPSHRAPGATRVPRTVLRDSAAARERLALR
ncbi:hypothetical protein MRX96_007085 [Rhipicephalus microplus]